MREVIVTTNNYGRRHYIRYIFGNANDNVATFYVIVLINPLILFNITYSYIHLTYIDTTSLQPTISDPRVISG